MFRVILVILTLIELEPKSLKQLCRLAILRHVTRLRYALLPALPLPTHLQVLCIVFYHSYHPLRQYTAVQDYVAHYREWGPPPPPLPLQCGQARPQQPTCSAPVQPNTVSINGRRVILCSFNGVVFQVCRLSVDKGCVRH